MTHLIIPPGGLRINEDNPGELFNDVIKYRIQPLTGLLYRGVPDLPNFNEDDEIVAVSRHFYLRKRKEKNLEYLSPRLNKERHNIAVFEPLTAKEFKILEKQDTPVILHAARQLEKYVEKRKSSTNTIKLLKGNLLIRKGDCSRIFAESVSSEAYDDCVKVGSYYVSRDTYCDTLEEFNMIDSYYLSLLRQHINDFFKPSATNPAPIMLMFAIKKLVTKEISSFNDFLTDRMYSYDIVNRVTRVVHDTLIHVTDTDANFCAREEQGNSYILAYYEKNHPDNLQKLRLIEGELEL